jgi:hypothetical protein
LLREKVEKRQICSSTTEEKWMYALRHIFGLLDEEGTIDVGIKGLGDVFVDRLTRTDIEAWRDSWEPRINVGKKSPTTVNDWIAVHLTEQMQQRYSTARGHEQESAIARIIDLTRVQQRMRGGNGA